MQDGNLSAPYHSRLVPQSPHSEARTRKRRDLEGFVTFCTSWICMLST